MNKDTSEVYCIKICKNLEDQPLPTYEYVYTVIYIPRHIPYSILEIVAFIYVDFIVMIEISFGNDFFLK